METTKQFIISKGRFVEAYKLVKANAGAAGVDQQSLKDFELNLEDNLYKIWNRMSSGCYFPPPIKAVPIPKKSGGERILGVPTVSDRIAQMVVKLEFEPLVEKHFLSDSYGYRPNKSALDAVAVTRQRCWKYDWVIEFDIKGLFDNINHELLLKAVEVHTDSRWIKLYIKRWLTTPMQLPDGTLQERAQGVMQGGVISPVLSNLFLHYAFDARMKRTNPENPWCRYADDGVIHCRSEEEAKQLLESLRLRFQECGLELHPEKTKIIYCKDDNRRKDYPTISFDFLGYTFRQRSSKNAKTNRLFESFSPAVSQAAITSMRTKVRKSNVRNRSDLSLKEIAKYFNPILQGWINYYGKFHRTELYAVWWHFNKTLARWAQKKYKTLRGKTKSGKFIEKIAETDPNLFAHWRIRMIDALA